MPKYKLVKLDNGRIVTGEDLRQILRSENFNDGVPVLPTFYALEYTEGQQPGEPFADFIARYKVWKEEVFVPHQQMIQARAAMTSAFADALIAEGFELAMYDKDNNLNIVSLEEPRYQGKHRQFASRILGLNPPY